MVYMQLKLDHDIKFNPETIKLISDFKYKLCSINDVKNFSLHNKIITVGDVTTENILKAGIPIFLQIVDLKTKRGEKEYKHINGSIDVNNPPGMLTVNLMNKIAECIDSRVNCRIEVNGEEDLSVIPIIFYAECNTVIVYGIPDTGMAYIMVDNVIKGSIKNIIQGMNKNE